MPPAVTDPTSDLLHSPALPSRIRNALWRGSQIGQSRCGVTSTGWPALDAELPGSGWPHGEVIEILAPQPSVCEWRLLKPAIHASLRSGQSLILVGLPKPIHAAGLRAEGLDERKVVWIRAASPRERLWATEQLLRGNGGAIVAVWLPQAMPEQIRRLQVCAHDHDGLLFAFRPLASRHESSAAPVRLAVRTGSDWQLEIEVFKRRGAANGEAVSVNAIPCALEPFLTPRLLTPSSRFAAAAVRANQHGVREGEHRPVSIKP